MKRLIFLIILVIVGVAFVKLNPSQEEVQTKRSASPQQTSQESQQQDTSARTEITRESIFVPYWNVSGTIPAEYEKVIYFGVAGDEDGLIRDTGYQNMSAFQNMVNSSQDTYLTLRLLNTETNLEILENESAQQNLITETIRAAQTNGFDGVVIDLELSVLPVSEIEEQINSFFAAADTQFEAAGLHTAVAMYGDTFYRARPFDLAFIGKHSDEIMIMAYDFSKSYGEPGPNFPLTGRETYGYDFQTMIGHYLEAVPAQKLTVIFGMYGWNWPIGPQGKPLTRATAMSLNDIRASYLEGCSFRSCSVSVDAESAESVVKYVDKEGTNHVVWFENEESVEAKKRFLEIKGIESISYWVWGYFN